MDPQMIPALPQPDVQAPLADVDAALDALRALPRRASDPPGAALAPGVSVQHRGGAGVVAAIEGLGDAVLLDLADRGGSPWFSLEIALPPERLQGMRFFGLRSAGESAAGLLSLRPTLRLHAEDGWRDLVFPRDHVFTPEPGENLGAVALDDPTGAPPVGAVLILFLQQRSGALRLTRIDPFLAA